MLAIDRTNGSRLGGRGRRGLIRLVAAALSAVCAVIYFLIGLGVIYPATPATDQAGLLVFGLLAGGAFALGAGLLLTMDRRAAWVLGAAFQVLAIVAYFQVAERRTPPFELWGVVLKVLQVAILAALVYLIVRRQDVGQRAAAPTRS
jgi:hypothetical protein